jgi:hypothetical protein
MVSKKQKERKKKIQERQKQSKNPVLQLNALQMTHSRLSERYEEADRERRLLRQSDVAQGRRILDLERKLRARERDVAEMHNNHIKMRGSLTQIREMHLPERPTYDVNEDVPCRECQKRWPCPTYRKIRTPDHVVVSSLLDIARDLAKEDEDGSAPNQA